MRLTRLRADSRCTPTARGRQCRMSKESTHQEKYEQMSSSKASSVRSEMLLRSGNFSSLTLWWVTADWLLKVTSTPSSKSLMYKKEKKTSSSPMLWHRYAKRTIGWLCPSSSRCKQVRGQPQRDQGRTSGTMCTCAETKRGTHACRVSKLGPVEQSSTQNGKLGITIQDPPPESGRRTHLFILLIRIVSCHMSKKTCPFTACFMSLIK